MKKKLKCILFIELFVLSILFILIVSNHFKSNHIKKINSETNVSISSNHRGRQVLDKSVTSNSGKNYVNDHRRVFSVPYGNDMMNGHNSSNFFFTTWTAYYNTLSENNKLHATSSFGKPYTFTNLKIDNN